MSAAVMDSKARFVEQMMRTGSRDNFTLPDPTITELSVLEDLTGIEGIEIVSGSAEPKLVNDVPVFREVKVRIPTGHAILNRIIHPRTNYLVLTPANIFTDADPGEGQPHFRIVTAKDGDERRVQWFKNSLRSINEAKALFDELVGKGMTPYKIDPTTGGAGSEIMKVFDPAAEEVIFMDMRAVVGG